jgi:predicted branched-subunit amino acid permease
VSVAGTLAPAEGAMPFSIGLRESVPVAVSFAISFFAIGALSQASNLTFAESVAMTTFVFAGPAQYAILALITSGASLSVIWLSALIINFRFLIVAMNLLTAFRGVPRRRVLPALPMLSASTFALTSIGTGDRSHGPDNFRYYLGVCAGTYPVALLMTGVGWGLATSVSSDFAKTVPVILPIYFAVMLAKEWGKWGSLGAAALAFVLHPVLLTTFSKDVANVATALVAALTVSGIVNLTNSERT